uniref:uncharacterized protein LOC101473170 n=1 Tax=Maylandia zebra TaxID=106582 RepID=UPI000D30B378|nr:uncharacterized protein LOC101473170 [Maylandia zebra]
MSVDSDNSCVLLSSRDSRTSCIFQTADEKDDIPGVGEESVLEMLSYSKFSDLETWLCMPSSLLLSRPLDSTHTSSGSSSNSYSSRASLHSANSLPASSSSSLASNSRHSTCSEPGEIDRSSERDSTFLTPTLTKEATCLSTPLLPILSSTPAPPPAAAASRSSYGTHAGDSASHSGVSIRKRRRLAASPGGLHWTSSGVLCVQQRELIIHTPACFHAHILPYKESLPPGWWKMVKLFYSHTVMMKEQRDLWSPDPSPGSRRSGGGGAGARSLPLGEAARVSLPWATDRALLRKTISVDDRLLQPVGGEQRHLRLLNRLERGRKKLRSIHSPGTSGRYDTRKKSDSKTSRLAQRWNQRLAGDALIKDLKPLYCSGDSRSSLSLDSRRLPGVMTQQMQNLQLSQTRKCPGGPASPNAAKRLYRNLSEKLRGSTSSFEDAYFFGKTDRLRKASTMQGSDCIFEAVEQQDLDAVQILLYQCSAEELDLNTPNSQGLTPLDIAIMTNNTPIAKLLLKAGGKESPHCEYATSGRFGPEPDRSTHSVRVLVFKRVRLHVVNLCHNHLKRNPSRRPSLRKVESVSSAVLHLCEHSKRRGQLQLHEPGDSSVLPPRLYQLSRLMECARLTFQSDRNLIYRRSRRPVNAACQEVARVRCGRFGFSWRATQKTDVCATKRVET